MVSVTILSIPLNAPVPLASLVQDVKSISTIVYLVLVEMEECVMIQSQVTLVNALQVLRDLVVKRTLMIVSHHHVNMGSVWMAKIRLAVHVIQATPAICVNIKLTNVNQILVSMEDDVKIWSTAINACVMLEPQEQIVRSMSTNVTVIRAGIMPNVWMVSIGMQIFHRLILI